MLIGGLCTNWASTLVLAVWSEAASLRAPPGAHGPLCGKGDCASLPFNNQSPDKDRVLGFAFTCSRSQCIGRHRTLLGALCSIVSEHWQLEVL